MSLSRLARRAAEVFREGGVAGVAWQTCAKVRYHYTVATFRPHVIDKTLAGHTMRIAINNLFAKGWVEDRIEWRELEWVAQHMIRPDDTVIDCGANNGFTSVFFANCVGPGGRVIAYEPLPRNAADVRQNIELNSLSNVDLRQMAVGRHEGVVSMLDAPNGILGHGEAGATIDVPIVSLDDSLLGVVPNFIKVDVEGHELEVLAGAKRTLAERPRLDIEVHPVFQMDRLAQASAVVAALEEFEYELYVQAYPDGPIVHWNRSAIPLTSLAQANVFHLLAVPSKA